MVKRLIVNMILEYGGRFTKSVANAYKRVASGEGKFANRLYQPLRLNFIPNCSDFMR
jgi:hypothetical protein